MKLKLFIVQNSKIDYTSINKAVVAAESADDVVGILENEYDWCSPMTKPIVTQIGVATTNMTAIVCADIWDN